MDIERGNIEIIFKNIPYNKITINCADKKKRHDYCMINKNIFIQYSYLTFPHYSADERENCFQKLVQDMTETSFKKKNIFLYVMKVAEKMLIYDGCEVRCRFEELLRWREISFQLGQDFFSCAFLAKHDLLKQYERKYFAWSPILYSNNERLQSILKKGIADNHFHLGGSTKIFELNWISLMNQIEDRVHDFLKIKHSLNSYLSDCIQDAEKKEDLYEMCQRAALYRVYLFVTLKKREYHREKLLNIIKRNMNGTRISELIAEIQDIISEIQYLYGAQISINHYILDYALERKIQNENNNQCRLLAGERKFLYDCYKACVTDQFNDKDKNYFYIYLKIRTVFRGEIIQNNGKVGFANFKEYQDRKEYFIEGRKEYERELVRLSLNETLMRKNIVSLEARICPASSSKDLYQKLNYYNKVVECECAENASKLIYVLHFPKRREDEFIPTQPRNYVVRKRTAIQARSIVAMMEKDYPYKIKECVRGIDACTSEIGCRPDVFAQVYRYLRAHFFYYFTSRPEQGKVHTEKGLRLQLTYHAGEDFLDIIDGLRAIDEAIIFCGLERGCRIGHALALGINPQDYYEYKNQKIILTKQVLLDDLAWMICRPYELGCEFDNTFRIKLEEKFYQLYEEVYGKEMSGEYVSAYDYYQSWKLRGDNPIIYRGSESNNLKVNKNSLDEYCINPNVDWCVRNTLKYRKLYYLYHFSEKVREKGNEITEYKVESEYIIGVQKLQDILIGMIATKGISIETNPSSNYLIGTIQKYEKHPILRFNSRKLKNVLPNRSINVSINTDDQGVFDTLLENEYALMALALKKAKRDNGEYIYDIEDIYEWLDYVRQMGIEQIFKAEI